MLRLDDPLIKSRSRVCWAVGYEDGDVEKGTK